MPETASPPILTTNPLACSRRRLADGHFPAMLIVTARISPPILAAPGQQTHIKASNTDAGDYFGSSGAVSGDTVVVGAPQASSNATGVNGNPGDNGATDSSAACPFPTDTQPPPAGQSALWQYKAIGHQADARAGQWGDGFRVSSSGSNTT